MMFVSPNAPAVCDINPGGFQWFPIQSPRIDSKLVGAALARPVVLQFLEELWAQTGLSARDTVLAGFSQGAMMALHVGLSLDEPLMAVVACSGAFLPPEGFGARPFAKPPVALIHGDADQVVPVELSREAADVLKAAGVDVRLHISHGTGHGIAPDGLQFAVEFLSDKAVDKR
jgi:phospholipase/carboxylesterase